MCLVSCEAFDVLLVQVVGELKVPGKVHVDHHEWCGGGEVGLVEGALVFVLILQRKQLFSMISMIIMMLLIPFVLLILLMLVS